MVESQEMSLSPSHHHNSHKVVQRSHNHKNLEDQPLKAQANLAHKPALREEANQRAQIDLNHQLLVQKNHSHQPLAQTGQLQQDQINQPQLAQDPKDQLRLDQTDLPQLVQIDQLLLAQIDQHQKAQKDHYHQVQKDLSHQAQRDLSHQAQRDLSHQVPIDPNHQLVPREDQNQRALTDLYLKAQVVEDDLSHLRDLPLHNLKDRIHKELIQEKDHRQNSQVS